VPLRVDREPITVVVGLLVVLGLVVFFAVLLLQEAL
jgi:hypothetical protein